MARDPDQLKHLLESDPTVDRVSYTRQDDGRIRWTIECRQLPNSFRSEIQDGSMILNQIQSRKPAIFRLTQY